MEAALFQYFPLCAFLWKIRQIPEFSQYWETVLWNLIIKCWKMLRANQTHEFILKTILIYLTVLFIVIMLAHHNGLQASQQCSQCESKTSSSWDSSPPIPGKVWQKHAYGNGFSPGYAWFSLTIMLIHYSMSETPMTKIYKLTSIWLVFYAVLQYISLLLFDKDQYGRSYSNLQMVMGITHSFLPSQYKWKFDECDSEQ